jgi:hypothetical protein
VHTPPGRARLLRHQHVPQHRLRRRAHLHGRAGNAHAALAFGIVGEVAGAAPAGMDLRLHHIDRAGKPRRCRLGLIRRPRHMPIQHRNPEAAQQLLGLVFMDVHGSDA